MKKFEKKVENIIYQGVISGEEIDITTEKMMKLFKAELLKAVKDGKVETVGDAIKYIDEYY